MRSSAVVVAFGDAYLIFDPYPGYGILEKRRSGTYEAYIRWKNELIATLLKIRDEPIEVLEEASRDLPLRGSEHDAIFESRGNVMRLFDALSRRTAKPTNAPGTPGRDLPRPTRSTSFLLRPKWNKGRRATLCGARSQMRRPFWSTMNSSGHSQAIVEIGDLVEERAIARSGA